MSGDRKQIKREKATLRRPSLARARILPTQDGRTVWAKIVRSTLSNLISHCGGENNISETRRLAARRVASLEAELQQIECGFAEQRANGDAPSADALDLYGRLADRQRRLSDALGWSRTARDVTALERYISGDAPVAGGRYGD